MIKENKIQPFGRLGWTLVVGVVIVASAGLFHILLSVENMLWVTSGSRDPFYWSVAQVQMAALNLKTELRFIEAGGDIDSALVSGRVGVLSSRINILTQPSEFRETYRRVPNFDDDIAHLQDFSENILSTLNKEPLTKNKALHFLERLDEISFVIVEIANNAWFQDNLDKEEAQKNLIYRRTLVNTLVASLMFLLIIITISWWRYRRASIVKKFALDSERRAVKTKMLFLGMVSHELRSPLQNIISAIDLLEKRQTLPTDSEITCQVPCDH